MSKQVSKRDEEICSAIHQEIAPNAIAIAEENPMISGLFDRMYGDLKNLPADEAAVSNGEPDYYSAAKKIRALQAKKRREHCSRTFAQRVTDEDAILARGMGIRLD